MIYADFIWRLRLAAMGSGWPSRGRCNWAVEEPDRFNRGFNSPAYQALKKIDPEMAKKAEVPTEAS